LLRAADQGRLLLRLGSELACRKISELDLAAALRCDDLSKPFRTKCNRMAWTHGMPEADRAFLDVLRNRD
jgi:hypothetical protein